MKLESNTVKKCLLSISQVKWYQTINDKAKRYNFPQQLLKLETVTSIQYEQIQSIVTR